MSDKQATLKRYKLICPKCDEGEVLLPAGEPEKPWCAECEEDIDIGDIAEFVAGWSEYLKDREALLSREKETTEIPKVADKTKTA